MDKLKLSNPINWLKAKSQFRYKKFVNEGENEKGNNFKYVPLVNETSPVKWQRNKKFKNYTGKGYKAKKRQKGKKRQLGKGKKRNKRK